MKFLHKTFWSIFLEFLDYKSKDVWLVPYFNVVLECKENESVRHVLRDGREVVEERLNID